MKRSMRPEKFVKQPVTVEAMRWDGTAECARAIVEWILGHDGNATYWGPCEWDDKESAYIRIETLEGDMLASHGDYVIRGVAGEFYPVKSQIFKETYEMVEDN